MVLHIVFLGLLLSQTIELPSILSTLLNKAFIGLLHICPNHLRRDSTIFSRCYLNFFSKAFIPNLILSSLSTYPTQHSHFCYIGFFFWLFIAQHESPKNLYPDKYSNSETIYCGGLQCSTKLKGVWLLFQLFSTSPSGKKNRLFWKEHVLAFNRISSNKM